MGYLDYLNQRRQTSAYYPAPPTGTGGFTTGGGGPSGFKPVNPPAKFDINKLFGGAFADFTKDPSRGTMNVLAQAGALPSRIYESPVSLVQTIEERNPGFLEAIFGELTPGGKIMNAEFRKAGTTSSEAIGKIPLIGPAVSAVAGAADALIRQSNNFTPGFINAEDAKVWGAVGNLPGTTEITGELLAKHGIMSDPFGEQTGGIPLVGGVISALSGGWTGPGGRNKTVAEFREELAKRGFFWAEDGAPLSPEYVAGSIASGQRDPGSFGHAAVNDDALVDGLSRMAVDPTNLLLLTGAGAAARLPMISARLAGMAAKLPIADRLVRAGMLAPQAVGASQSAAAVGRVAQAVRAGQAVVRSDAAQMTLRGLATAVRGYRRASLATYGTNQAANKLSAVINEVTDDELAMFVDMEDFTNAVLERHPMSDNAGFMLLSAVAFPFRQYAQNVRGAAGGVTTRRFGRGNMDAIYREAADTVKAERRAQGLSTSRPISGRSQFQRWVGGPEKEARLQFHLDMHLAAKAGMFDPQLTKSLADAQSLPEIADIVATHADDIRAGVDAFRRDGKATSGAREAQFRQWFEEGAGAVIKDEYGKELQVRGVRPWNIREAARQWSRYSDIQHDLIAPVLRETGVTVGLRNTVLKEDITSIRQNLGRLAVSETRNGKTVQVVPVAEVLKIMDRHPYLSANPKETWWVRFLQGEQKAPTLAAIRAKLSSQNRKAQSANEYYASVAQYERAAPEQIVRELVDRRQISNTSSQIDGLREAMDDPAITPEAYQLLREQHGELIAERKATINRRNLARADRDGMNPDLANRIEADARQFIKDQLDPNAPEFIDPIDPSIKMTDPVDRTLVTMLEREMADISPYRPKAPPGRELIKHIPEGAAVPIRYRTALGEWLYNDAGGGRLSNFTRAAARGGQALVRPVPADTLHTGTRQALVDMMLPLGFKPKEVDAILTRLWQETQTHGTELGAVELRLYRDIGALLPRTVNKIFADAVHQMPGSRGAKLFPKLQEAGGGYRILSKSSSRYYRNLKSRADKGEPTAQKLLDAYHTSIDGRVWGKLTASERVLARMVYPLWRFALDPRWIMLNHIEGGILAASKYGVIGHYRNEHTGGRSTAASDSMLGRVTQDEARAAAIGADIGFVNTYGNKMSLLAQDVFNKQARRRGENLLNAAERPDPKVLAGRQQIIEQYNAAHAAPPPVEPPPAARSPSLLQEAQAEAVKDTQSLAREIPSGPKQVEVVAARAKKDAAVAALDEIGPEPPKPPSERRAFGTRGREKAAPEVVAVYDALSKPYRSWRTKYLRLKKEEVQAQNEWVAAERAASLERNALMAPTTPVTATSAQLEAPGQTLPPEPGTIPKTNPEYQIRAYHFTKPENLDSILVEGLRRDKAQGEIYGEPNMIWFSTKKPSPDQTYIEVLVDARDLDIAGAPELFGARSTATPEQRIARIEQIEANGSDFTVTSDVVPPDQIITHNRPWFHTYKYLVENPGIDPASVQFILHHESQVDQAPAARKFTGEQAAAAAPPAAPAKSLLPDLTVETAAEAAEARMRANPPKTAWDRSVSKWWSERDAHGEARALSQDMQDAINQYGDSDLQLRDLKVSIAREGERIRYRADQDLADGRLTAAEHADQVRIADEHANISNKRLSEILIDEMYQRDEPGGLQKLIDENVNRLLTAEERVAAAPLLRRLHDVNLQVWEDVRATMYGNPSRSNLERTLNSFWLFWPISYQIKAVKWLADIMLGGSFGFNTNALLGAKFAVWEQEHQKEMANNPSLQALYEANPTLWFAAEMLMPMTPDGMGVSLNRIVRNIGDTAAMEVLGAEEPPFGTFSMAEDPSRAAGYWLNMGPLYTVDWVQRVLRDVYQREQEQTTVPSTYRRSQPSLPALTVPLR